MQEATYGKKVELAHRETVESEADTILQPAREGSVAFLVVGDPFGCVPCRAACTCACARAVAAAAAGQRGVKDARLRLLTRAPTLPLSWLPHHAVSSAHPTPHPAPSPRSATTHTDLLLRAQALGIVTHVVHNASIMNAVGACGLQLYSFGQTVSIPFFRAGWRPDSFYDKIAYNAGGGMHTLCLLGAWRHARAAPLWHCPAVSSLL